MHDFVPAFVQLEKSLAQWPGTGGDRYVTVCSSGTAALHLALETLNLPPGSEVILPDFTMIACARAVVKAGLIPVFVDCNPMNLLMRPELIEAAVTRRTEAIMAVHVYGRQCDMDSIHMIAANSDLAVIEDLAEAHGVPPHPNTDAACWSFYGNKIIGGEEGGAAAFLEESHAARAKKLRCLGFTDDHDYTHIPRGENYRLANSLANLILASLRRSGENIAKRRIVEGWYRSLCPFHWSLPRRDAVWVYDLRIPGMFKEEQKALVGALNAAGIAARYSFKPMSTQPEFINYKVIGKEEQAARAAREVIYLPVYPDTPLQDVSKAFKVIREVTGRR